MNCDKTVRSYWRGCRCGDCKKANADYQRLYMANRKTKMAVIQ